MYAHFHPVHKCWPIKQASQTCEHSNNSLTHITWLLLINVTYEKFAHMSDDAGGVFVIQHSYIVVVAVMCIVNVSNATKTCVHMIAVTATVHHQQHHFH